MRIEIFSESKLVSDEQLKPWIAALRIQVVRDFSPAWGASAYVALQSRIERPYRQKVWSIGIFDDADQANALGYHEVGPGGVPTAKVFAQTIVNDQVEISSVISHELLEMLVNPYDQYLVFNGDDKGGVLLPAEVCDPVEGSLYQINGVSVSDFIFPTWFGGESNGVDVQYDFLKQVNAPFQIASQGYLNYLNVSISGAWQQVFGDKRANKKATEYSSR